MKVSNCPNFEFPNFQKCSSLLIWGKNWLHFNWITLYAFDFQSLPLKYNDDVTTESIETRGRKGYNVMWRRAPICCENHTTKNWWICPNIYLFYLQNFTAIVDVANRRCFIMPLDRSLILPPKSLFDLLFKMSNGKLTSWLISKIFCSATSFCTNFFAGIPFVIVDFSKRFSCQSVSIVSQLETPCQKCVLHESSPSSVFSYLNYCAGGWTGAVIQSRTCAWFFWNECFFYKQ